MGSTAASGGEPPAGGCFAGRHQAMIIPITDKQADYADGVAQKLKDADIRVEVDRSRDRMQAKIREVQLQKIPYMLVVGNREAEAGTAAIRLRTEEDLGARPVDLASA